MTQISQAKRGRITPELSQIATDEKRDPRDLADAVARGHVVVPANPRRASLKPVGIGKSLRTKVNVNIGTSQDFPELDSELAKADIAMKYRTDTLMDLSTGGDIRSIRKSILERAPVPLGTVPIYQAAIHSLQSHGSIIEMTAEDMFGVVEDQAREGVDFMTIHAGLTSRAIERLKDQGRVADVVSRGGAFHVAWTLHHQKENPFFAQFDRLLDIAFRYDVTLSLGDGLRPGSILDATDRPQIEELITLGELVKRGRAREVQVMVEGPGHVPLDQVEMNMTLQKRLCNEAPFYVLGPLVTDIAPGYDHIVGAIGGAVAAAAGADFLCYVTPAEHLGLPSADDVREGLVASKIAAHAADLVKGIPGARELDLRLSEARKKLDWDKQRNLVIDPFKFEEIRQKRQTKSSACSMCGEFCAMRLVTEFLNPGGKAEDVRC